MAAKSPQDNFIRCHAALYAFLSHTIPSLQHAIDTWHQKIKAATQLCSTPAQCPPYKKPSTKNNSCPNCIVWATAIGAQVYPPSAVGSLQWMNANSTLFCNDPLEVIKLFVLRMPVNQRNAYSSLGDFDTASLLMIMGKFKEFHHGDKAVFDLIQKVAQIRNFLAHMKHAKNLHLDDKTFNNYWSDITNLVNSLPGLGNAYFSQKAALDVITKLTEIKDQSIPATIQEEALKPVVEDIVLKTIKDIKPTQINDPSLSEPLSELSTDSITWQKQLQALYRSKRSGIGFLPGSYEEFPSDEFFVDLQLAKEQKTPTHVTYVDLETYTDVLTLRNNKGHKLKHVLVSGLAGMGKTTMMSRLAYQWASTKEQNKKDNQTEESQTKAKFEMRGSNIVSNLVRKFKAKGTNPSNPVMTSTIEPTSTSNPLDMFQHVFLLDLRKITAEMTLVDAIQSQLLQNVSRHKLEEYLTENANKCLYLVDGFDELGIKDMVLKSQLLYDSHVIVSTRPNKVVKFHEIHQNYVQVDMVGFTEENIVLFIRNFFQSTSEISRTQELLSEIGSNYVIDNLKHIPLLLGMICFIWKEKQSLPKTVSHLYHLVIEFLLRHRKACEAGDTGELSSEEFKEHVQFDQVMASMGKTALQGLLNDSKLVFKEDEFDSPEVIKRGCSLGILSSESKINGFDRITYVFFIHKTFQEYCAALYLTSLPDSDATLFKTILSRMDFDDMEYVLRFCCGRSQRAAELALKCVVHQLLPTESTESKLGTKDSSTLPLILLFEAESTFGVKRDLHIIVRPGVHNVTTCMYSSYHNPVFLTAVQYFVSNFNTQNEWTSHVKMVTIYTDSPTLFKHSSHSNARQIELLQKIMHIKKISLCVVYLESIYHTNDLQTLHEHTNRLVGPVDELILTMAVSCHTIYRYLHQAPHSVKLHLAGIKIDHGINPKRVAYVLQTIHSKYGSVKGLDASHTTAINDEVIKYVAPFYKMMRSIELDHVNLSQDCVDVMLDDMQDAGKLSFLEKVSLEGNSINSSHAKVLAVSMKEMPKLRVLNLRDNELRCEGVRALSDSFQYTTKLEKINMDSNDIGCDGLKSLAAVLQYTTELRVIWLSRNKIECDGAKAIASALESNTSLEQLYLSDNQIQCDGAKAIASTLATNKGLISLYLSRNQIQCDGAKAIASALKSNTRLKALGLSRNQIQCDGAKAIASALESNTSLWKLELYRNQIQCDGVTAIASALKSNANLVQLYLSDNQIQCDGAKAIASALVSNKSLEQLYLSYNQIQCDEAKAIASALEKNTSLWRLELDHNQIKSDGAKSLAAALQSSEVTDLYLYDNQIGSDGAEALRFAAKNATIYVLI